MIDVLIGMLQESNPFLIIIAGLMIGLLHAFEPDHLSAVSTQLIKKNNNDRDSTDSQKQEIRHLTVSSSLRGALWGIGHTTSIILIGLLIAGLSLNLSDSFLLGAEIVVGVMLIILGIVTATNKSILRQKHVHHHRHSNGISHTHHHTHKTDHRHSHKSYLIGCVHGIAGSGSIVALTASTMNGFDMMVYFLILFGIGSIIGMAAASGILGLSFVLLPKTSLATRYLRYVIAGVSFIIGVNIVLSIVMSSKVLLH